MTHQETTQVINALCWAGKFETLYRSIKYEVPGCKAILMSDRTAEQKRRALLKVLKEQQ